MALQITETRGMFSVYGELNGGNANILNRHMNRFIHRDRQVILNLERLEKIDSCAAYALQELFLSAMHSNSLLSIIGLENENILPIMAETRTSYILSHDRD